MLEDTNRRERDGRGTPARGSPGRDRPSTPGWRITGPGGRTPTGAGGGAGGSPNPRTGRWLVIALVLGLLALNLWISYEAQQPASRVRIPYSPTFINEVNGHNVADISSTGSSIQGTFRSEVKYPSNSTTAKPTKLFSTQIPSFR